MKYLVHIFLCFLILACSNEKDEPALISKTDTIYIEKENLENEAKQAISNADSPIKKTEASKDAKLKKNDEQTANPYINSKIEFKIFDSEGGTFGYDIIIDGSAAIHQPNIPGMPGNKGFHSKEQAEKTAQFVITKIRKNIMPPTVTIEELDSLKVLR